MGAAALFASTSSLATPFFVAPVEGDWFDGTSWSSGTAPTAADDPLIDNGATATASSASPLYPGGGAEVEAQGLAIGSRLDPSRPVDASGALEMTDLDLSLAGDLSVGVIDIDPDVPGAVSGSLSAAGGSQTPGNVSVGGATRVGVLGFEAADGSSATGALEVGGDLETTGVLDVGLNEQFGVASGQVVVGGELRVIAVDSPSGAGIARVRVGESFAFAPQTLAMPTTGSLSVAGDLRFVYDGASSGTQMFIGTASGSARADGRLDVGGDVIGFQFVYVGMASADDFPETGNETVAVGELHVAGSLDYAPVFLSPRLAVGITQAGFRPGFSRAEGYATFGAVEGRLVEVGIAGAGPATGVVEIGSGGIGATVGKTTSNADAQGTLTTGGYLGTAEVGVSTGGGFETLPFIAGNAVGSLTAAGFVRNAVVGLLNSDGSASGYLEVEGVDRGTSLGGVSVGVSGRGAGTADGRMLVRSGGIAASRIAVGALEGASAPPNQPFANGTVTGVLESTGDVTSRSSFGGDAVGYANAQSGGYADGTWILHDGTFTGRKLIVGLSQGTGTATGRVHLDRMLVDTDNLTLGDGATVEIDIQGLLRGLEYSAIDATVAKLDGDLAVAFVAPAQLGVYDLIVSGALDGITGDFDAVSISGLASDQQAFWGFETATIGAAPVEVFRLHVVPEPASSALLALGLLGLTAHAANRPGALRREHRD